MDICVMKFGGMATGTKKNRELIVNIVKNKNKKILLVASAMGRIGFPYATDTLLELVDENYLFSSERNRLLATGEVISTIVLANQLKQNKINAYAMSLRELGMYSTHIDTANINSLFEKYDVLVAPGFLTLNDVGEVETLARGGGDYSAVLLAHALNVKKVCLYKDVIGIMPFVFPGYKKIKCYENLDYLDAVALANIGCKVIQKDALMMAKEFDITLEVKSFLSDDAGTIVNNCLRNNEYIGMSFTKDSLLVAVKNIETAKKDLETTFLENRLYFKEILVKNDCLEFKFGVNQLQLAKKKMVEKYFIHFL